MPLSAELKRAPLAAPTTWRQTVSRSRPAGWFQPETVRLTAAVLSATGDHMASEASYSEAIASVQQQNAKLWELRTATSLVELWRNQSKRTEAHELLAPVYR